MQPTQQTVYLYVSWRILVEQCNTDDNLRMSPLANRMRCASAPECCGCVHR